MALRGLSASPSPWQTRVRNSPHPSTTTLSLSRHADREHIARLFFAGGAVVSLGGLLMFGLLPLALQPGTRAVLAGGCLLMCAVFMLLLWRVASLPLAGAVRVAAWAASALTGLVALGLGSGIHSQILGYWPLLITVTAVLASTRSAAVLTAACASMATGLALNELTQRMPTAAALGGEGLLLPLATISLMLAASFVVGALISMFVHRSLRQASEREQRFRELLGMSVDWYWELDQQLRFVQVETSPGVDSGIATDDHIGLAPWDIADFGLDDDEMDAHRADLEAHEPFSRLLMRRTDAQGQTRFISASGKPRLDAGGAFRGYWGVGHDITAEVRAQQAVQASETRYRELFDRSPTPLVLHRGGRVLDANFAAATMCGVDSPEGMVGFDLLTLYRGETARASALARLRQVEQLAIGEGLPVADFVLHSPTGRQLAVQATAVRVMAEDGPATLSIYFDVTARRAAEAALRRSEALLSHLFATSPGCITLTEMASGRYVMVNPGFTRVTGYESSEVIGRTWSELGIWYDPSDRERLVAAIHKQGSVNDMTPVIVAKSGALVSLQLSAARFEMAGKDYLVINAHDITESERARLEHAAILQSASVGIAFVRDGRFQQVNPSWERMFGCAPGRVIGERVDALWPDMPGEAALRAPFAPGQGERAATHARPLEIEREMRRLDGSVFWCRLLGQSVNPTHPTDGGTLWIAEDITERRRMDQALAHALDQAEAASRAKSAFLANTSHEIRTPLNGLLGLARLAQQPALEAPQRQQYLTQIVDNAQGLADVISDVLDLSKIEAGRFTLEAVPFGLRELMQSTHRSYLALAQAKGLQLTLALADDAPDAVLGDPVRTRQILVNFLTNAIKFTESGSIQLELRRGAQGRVRLSVADSGPGIDEATQRRLFLPFSQADESTTRRYGGTGLGLSICRELAHMMGGEVGVQSEPGRGSRFWAELPLPPASPSTPEARHAEPDMKPLKGAHVLMVEDNPVNMMIAVAQLELWGARVDQALDGLLAIEAVDRAAAAGDQYDVVLMDLQMPRMGGNEATRALRQRYPASTLPIIALTAAALVSEREQALQAGMNDFLTKPIDAPQLLRALTAVL
jgi:PAS domain S-box-containing protein